MATKVIFLDIDGVLNSNLWVLQNSGAASRGTSSTLELMRKMINTKHIPFLQRVVSETGAQIVVSSSWRDVLTIDELRDIFSSYGLDAEIIGTTPPGHVRRDAIERWLAAHSEISRYVVLDDFDLDVWAEHVRTDVNEGMSNDDATRAIEVLNS